MFVPLARRPRLRRAVTLQSRSAGRRDARGPPPPPHACRAPRADTSGCTGELVMAKCWSTAPLSAVAPSPRRHRATAPYSLRTPYRVRRVQCATGALFRVCVFLYVVSVTNYILPVIHWLYCICHPGRKIRTSLVCYRINEDNRDRHLLRISLSPHCSIVTTHTITV